MSEKYKAPVMIGVDVGTTSVKVLAANEHGEEYVAEESTYHINQPRAGFREQDPEVLFKATEATMMKVLEKSDRPVAGFCVSTAMHSLLAVDQQGVPLTPAIIWADNRSLDYAEELRNKKAGKQIYQRTGAPIHAMLPLCKIAWIRDHQPAVFEKAHKFISLKEYFFYRWFATYIIDYSMASATGLFDMQKLTWVPEALAFAGITEAKLSMPVPTTHIIKDMPGKLAEKFKLPADTPFVLGASDGCLANLNASGLNAKEATLTLGTSGAIRITVEKFKPDPDMRVFNYILTEKYHIIGGPTNNGGIILEWLLESLYPDLSDPAEVLEKAEKIPAGAEGLVCVPYFYGERAPVWNEKQAGVFYGVLSHHTRDHFARAALEGIVFNLCSIGKGLNTATMSTIEAIWADGGLTRSDFIVQMISDVFNLPVYLSDSSHGADRGAVLLGAYALGLIDSLHQDTKNHREKTFRPNKKQNEVYQKSYQLFEKTRKMKVKSG